MMYRHKDNYWFMQIGLENSGHDDLKIIIVININLLKCYYY